MRVLVNILAVVGFLSISHVAYSQLVSGSAFPVEDGDVLTAEILNQLDARLNIQGGLGFDINDPCGGGTRYDVGDTGPAGGLVFYVTPDGCNGLEAAPVDQGAAEIWGCSAEVTNAVASAIGTGAINTLGIVGAGCTEDPESADLTRAYTGGGEGDWYLPSDGELVLMWTKIGPGTMAGGGFDDMAQYWSSSEVDADVAIAVDFSDGEPTPVSKGSFIATRAIRSFEQGS